MRTSTAKYLLEAGAMVNKWDFWGRTPLYATVDQHAAARRPARPPVARRHGAARDDRYPARGRRTNAQPEAVPAVSQLAHGPRRRRDLDIGTTPLLRAARGADIPAIELLVKAGALLDLPQRDGITPLMAAVGAGASSIDTRGKFRTALEAFETAGALLEAGAAIDQTDARGRTALHYAAAMTTDVVAARRPRRESRLSMPTASRPSTPRTASCAAADAVAAPRIRPRPKPCKAGLRRQLRGKR
jgi:hypothetical protein